MNRTNRHSGFTLVELMLAMSFIAVLLLAIAMITLQISNIYTRGVTMRQVNLAGQTIANDLQDTINASSPFLVNTPPTDSYVQKPGGGRLCTGQISYVWNYAKAIEDAVRTNEIEHLFNAYDGVRKQTVPIRFVKVIDPGKKLCKTVDGAYPPIPDNDPDNPSDDGVTTELLNLGGDRSLVIHAFSIEGKQPYATLAGQRLYAISFRLGTGDTSAITTTGCKPPANDESNLEYCAVNTFDIMARAGNHEEEP